MPQRRDSRYGKGAHQITQVPLEADMSADMLVSELERRFQRPSYQPPALPAVVLELNALTQDPNVAYPRVLHVLSRDPLLAGKVLKVAQSALYSRGRPPGSLADALGRLGLGKLTEICWQVAMSLRVFRTPGYAEALAALNAHSTLVGHLARELTRRLGLEERDAFVAGLLHDSGAAASLLLLGERRDAAPVFARAWPVVERARPAAGARLSRAWNLPGSVTQVLVRGGERRAEASPLEDVVVIANCVASRVAPCLETTPCSLATAEAARALKVGPADLDALTVVGRELARSLGVEPPGPQGRPGSSVNR